MKIFITALTLFLATSSVVAQIIEPQTEQRVEYDITKNWLGSRNVESYVGQTLYVAGKVNTLQTYGYANFCTKREGSSITGDRWGEASEGSRFNTRYEDLYGKHFVVDEIYKDRRHSSNGIWWFLLHEKNNPETTVWFEYWEDVESFFPFIVVSHFGYFKDNFIGRQYVSEFSEGRTYIKNKDIKTGELINHSLNDVWECVDITFLDNSSSIYLVIKNQKDQTSLLSTECLGQRDNGTYWIYDKPDYDKYVKKFGIANMNKIRQCKISVGMTDEMLKLSWGKPLKINRSSHGPDQWIYNGTYVYLHNGIITAWNEF